MANNYFKATSAKWKKLQVGVKTIFGILSGSVMVTDNPKMAFYVLLGGAVLNEIIEFFAPEDVPQSQYKSVADNIDTTKMSQN